jgi:hypothetical protein
MLPLKSTPKSVQSYLFPFIVSSTPLIVIFISLLYIVIIFYHLLPICTFLSIHPSSALFSSLFYLIPNFTSVIIPPAALSFFVPRFAL